MIALTLVAAKKKPAKRNVREVVRFDDPKADEGQEATRRG